MFNNKLQFKALTLAGASTCAFLTALLGVASLFGVGLPIVNLLASVFIGFDATVAGVMVGVVWGFFVGAVGGAFFSWIYSSIR